MIHNLASRLYVPFSLTDNKIAFNYSHVNLETSLLSAPALKYLINNMYYCMLFNLKLDVKLKMWILYKKDCLF